MVETRVSLRLRMQREKKLDCPRGCIVQGKHVKMDKLTNGKYIIDKCPICEGVWLDKDEIQAITKQSFWAYVKNYWRKD